ncbi:sigma-54 interaction domain-containing protein [Effusibacillus dendaii]|uniref:sigma-54 interaction domain-containing protein n=1 Tax=Effusibacillus dendaii TaxID=2743772 RepID=UPI0021F69CF4|nr:sigma 54-interacting transcriptional regulator [Effusibacillus dendaii]
MLESELFGYEKGAFSGAHPNGKPGLFELAVGGTILLDEIGDLPLNLQAKLLRVIQERELRRVGSTKTIPIDIRVISATNKDLKKLVKIGQFREDLYYRLNVIDIHIPPLRQRIEDIPLLLDYYMHKYGKEYGIKKRIAPDTLDCLRSYHWPGNIRELRNLLENLIVSTTSFEILPTHLPDCMKNQPEPQYLAAKEPETITLLSDERNHHGGLKQALEQVEYAMIQNALHKHGSIRQAAASLQIDHSTLIRKMRNLKICKP